MTERLDHATRQDQIVVAALALLADTPLVDLSTRSIARMVGLTQPALFRHFDSREALLLAVVSHARALIGAEVVDRINPHGPALDQLDAVVTTLLGWVETHPGLPRLLFGDPSGDAAALRVSLRHLVSMQRTVIAELVRMGQRSGELRADLDGNSVATLVVGMIQGVVLQWRLDDRPDGLSAAAGPLVAVLRSGIAVGSEVVADLVPAADAAADPVSVSVSDSVSDRQFAPPPQCTALHLDVRPILALGSDPLADVLRALETLTSASILAITAPFEARPLVALLGRAGHRVETESLGGGDWLLLVSVGGAAPPIDLRDLEPPEPLEKVLEMAARLLPGEVVCARLPRFPRLLLGHLDARSLAWQVAELTDGSALLHLRRPS